MRIEKKRLLRGRCRWAVLAALAVTASLASIPATSSAAAPLWEVQTRWGDQNLQPGGFGEFVVTTKNNGFEGSDGSPITMTLQLPPGVTRVAPLPGDLADREGDNWSCSGTSTVICTSNEVVESISEVPEGISGWAAYVFIKVAIAPEASGTHPVTTTIEGGGEFFTKGEDVRQVPIGGPAAGFGILPGSFQADAYSYRPPYGQPVRQAGTHPFEIRVDFEMNLKHGEDPPQIPGRSPESFTTPEGHLRTVETTLPRGMVGNPEAVPKCSPRDFLDAELVGWTKCPANTQVGYIDLQLSNGSEEHGFGPIFKHNQGLWTRIAVYNLEPPKGVPADFGFHVAVADGHIYPSLDPAQGYAIKASVPYTSDLAPIRHAKFTMWGVPGDPAHDEYRYIPDANDGKVGAPFTAPIRPLLTLSSDCSSANSFRWRADSWARPGEFTPTAVSEPSMQVSGCDDPRIRFEPEVTLEPTSHAASGPTGLQVNLKAPQRDQTVDQAYQLYGASGDIHGIDTPPFKKVVVTLPEGMTISTSAGQGLGSCTAAQIGLGTNDPVTCPVNSQYGTLTLRTPILPKDAPMTGRIYLAKQNDNPFNNFLTLYFVIQDTERGLLIKLPGKLDLDPVTGQITTTFDDVPQFPLSEAEFTFKGGNRAGLVNPATCGRKTITAEFYSWADPNTPVKRSSSYDITQKADGSPCVGSLRDRPFGPKLSAGTVSNAAGSYSPFVFRLTRSDDDQEFSQLGVKLPPGMLANISGISKCPAAAIGSAEAPGRSGAEEIAAPSCPASSLIGTSDVGSGVGQVLTYIPGKIYLAGPYKGAPLSMVVITPVVAGPFDLGVIAVRSAIDVRPETAEASVRTDLLPQIYKGIPVRLKDIKISVDRARTMINPTNCERMQITSHVTGTGGDVNTTADDTGADLAEHFQAGDCASLPFKPSLAFKLKGGTHRGDYPAFTATLRGRLGDANIARTAVTLPHSAFLAQEHIRTVCTRVQFAANACPDASIYGRASALSPLFDQTLEGPVYLRSSSNKLPDLVAKLDGEINVVLSGRIDSIKAQIRNTFDVVPDAPVTKFTLSMQGGKKGLIVNSRNLCKGVNRADVKMTGQNGKRFNFKPVVANSCKKARKDKKSKPAGKR